ncbi:pirin family protein [Sphingobacteriales bacterium UPWRP_1]|nr:pirin family protein [Sphingobacteriales bacterium TSM_CSS]PSJ75577.1 pirin family protein [Sphingobacteriales bacterium UPWRP_1]
MQFQLFKANARGVKDIGWLQSNFTFSFSSYQNPLRNGFGLLRVFNDDVVQSGGGFGLHPHINMEIISVMLNGSMNHKDTLGYTEVVEKDWVQIMSAGSGLRHEEHNVGTDEVNFLQIWIEPKLQNIMPRYQRRYFPEANRKNKLVTIVSNAEGADHCWINQNAQLSLGYFEQGGQVTYRFNPVNKCVFAFCISGQTEIAGQQLNERDAIGIWQTDSFTVNCLSEARFLLIEVPVNH